MNVEVETPDRLDDETPPTQVRSLLDTFYYPAQRNKLRLLIYLALSLVFALLLGATFGDHFNGGSELKARGRSRRQAPTKAPSEPLKDPYASRPRLQTRNGHLLIEASADKNIDFKTSSRGAVTINGVKLDQLIEVTRALERTVEARPSNKSKLASPSEPSGFEAALRNLLAAGDKFARLERQVDELSARLEVLDKKVAKNKRRITQRREEVSKLRRSQTELVGKLKRNDCFQAETGQPVCKNGATCVDAFEGFKCLCPANFEGPSCESDVDECAKFRGTELGCQNGAKCINLPGGYKCECRAPFHGVHCTEQRDDCALGSSRALCGWGKCVALAHSEPNQPRYTCACDQGWTTDGVSPACVVDIDECRAGAGSQLSAANSSYSSLVVAPWSNPAATYPCSTDPFVECINLPGSFQCAPCPPGYSGNGRLCRDIDECQTNNGGCSQAPLVECINTRGSRRCAPCPPGFTGDGTSCVSISACSNSEQLNGGCHPMARCAELPSVSLQARLCLCQYPYVGGGVGQNGCTLAPSGGPLLPPAGNNTSGASPAPAEVSAQTTTVAPSTGERRDPCKSSLIPRCQNGGKCRPLAARDDFECRCPPGFVGKSCERQGCGGRLTQDSGALTSPNFPQNYPANADCTWLIEAANPRQQLRLNFTSFQLERQVDNCMFDYLELRNGPSSESPLIGRFCNQDLHQKLILSHTSFVWLHFASDVHLQAPGFRLEWDGLQTGCGGKLTAASGQIDSPNYPQAFGHSADCEWTIEVARSNKVQLTVLDLDLSSAITGGLDALLDCPTNGTRQDYLEIFDSGPEFLGRSLGRFCHKRQLAFLNDKLTSTGNKLFLVYKSQALDNSRGFRLTYVTVCQDIELVGFRGVIESPGFPAAYQRHLNCSWLVRAPLGANLTFAVAALELEYSILSVEELTSAKQILLGVQRPPSAPTARQTAKFCTEDFVDIYAIYSPQGASESALLQGANLSSLVQFDATAALRLSGAQRRQKAIKNGRLARTLCGQLESMAEDQRLVELDTNYAYVRFETDRSIESRGFRLEWQSEGCGGQQVALEARGPNSIGGEAIQVVSYHEKPSSKRRPVECLWSYDLSKSAQTLEFHLHSDLRAPAGAQLADGADPCADASLTIYDGLTDKAPVLSRNCDAQRMRETVLSSSGQALVRFYSSGRHNYGRGFVLTGWPSVRDGCLSSVFDVSAPFNQVAGFKVTPGYPELYDAQSYRCYGLLNAHSGRLRFQLEELDIPTGDTTTSNNESPGSSLPDVAGAASSAELATPPSGLLEPGACRKSGNLLLIRSLVTSSVEEVFCGKLDKSKERDAARSELVLEQESAWLEFNTKGNFRGRWRLSYSRLCGSLVVLDSARDFHTPNYPSAPQWARQTRDDPAEASENVCIWRLKTNSISQATNDPISVEQQNELESQGYTVKPQRLHLNVVNFAEARGSGARPNDCLRVYEGVELSLRQARFNLSELDARYTPKLKLCRQTDLGFSSVFYISQGSELTLMTTGDTIAKVRVRPFENFCGGEFHLAEAEFASLGYPQPYAPDLDCHYFILGSPGARFQLKFLAFDLPEPEPEEVPSPEQLTYQVADNNNNNNNNSSSSSSGSTALVLKCDNVDYLEIRQLSSRKRLRSRLQSVLRLSTAYRWSDIGYLMSSAANNTNQTASGARLFELAKLFYLIGESQASSGASSRPAYVSRLFPSLDDFYENSKFLGRFCGKQAPPVEALANEFQDELLIRFRSHGNSNSGASGEQQATLAPPGANSRQPRGFLAQYKVKYGGLIQVEEQQEVGGGGGAGKAGADWLDVGAGFVSSPQYPRRTRFNDTVTWTFESKLGTVLQFDLVHLSLGSPHQDCADSLSLYDGASVETSVRLARLCGHLSFRNLLTRRLNVFFGPKPEPNSVKVGSLPLNLAHDSKVRANLIRPMRSSSNVATLVYENFRSEGLFLIRYKALNKTALLQQLNDTRLSEEPGAALDENEALRDQEEGVAAGEALRRDEVCSQTFRLAFEANSSQVVLSSPNWPKEPIEETLECHWLIYTQENSNIRLQVDPAVAPNNNGQSTASNSDEDSSWSLFAGERTRAADAACLDPKQRGPRNYLMLHDGATRLAPLIARRCLPLAPAQFQSSGRHLLVRYVHSGRSQVAPPGAQSSSSATDAARLAATSALFRARASIGECGGQFHILSSARIRDRPVSRPGATQSNKVYANNLDCRFLLFAANPDRVLVLHNAMSDFELAQEPTNADCSVGDYIEVRDLPLQTDLMEPAGRLTGRLLGRFCAGRPLEYIESPGSALSVEFHTDKANGAKGFELYVMSSWPQLNCPRRAIKLTPEEPFGVLSSPNWPHGFFNRRHCKYPLTSPLNQTIELTFLRLKRPTLDGVKCADTLAYLADNEAQLVRERLDSEASLVRDVRSPISGELIRSLVKEAPCQLSSALLAPNSKLAVDASSSSAPIKTSRPSNAPVELIEAAAQVGVASGAPGVKQGAETFRKLSAEDYFKLARLAPKGALRIKTESSMLLMDYEARNLLPGEGFLAIYRLSDERKFVCGGELSYRAAPPSAATPTETATLNNNNELTVELEDGESGSSAAPVSAASAPGSQLQVRNLLESAKFNEVQPEGDEFIQCEWRIRSKSSTRTLEASRGALQFNLAPTSALLDFSTSFLVFHTLEIPTRQPNQAPFSTATELEMEFGGEAERRKRWSERCGLTRLLVIDGTLSTQLACGNLTALQPWLLLDFSYSPLARVSLRTKNLRVKESGALLRGMRAFFYEKNCLQMERLIGETVRFRSHRQFPNSSYAPGLCRWELRLAPGDYELWFEQVRFRKPEGRHNAPNSANNANGTQVCDPQLEPDLDYIELRASSERNSPLLARFCAHNEPERRQKALLMSMRGDLSILFVAGVRQLAFGSEEFSSEVSKEQPPGGVSGAPRFFGFDMQLARVSNETTSEFCKRDAPNSIYWFIRSKDADYYNGGPFSVFSANPSLSGFLYPKKAHCVIELSAEDEARFNFTFRGLFDFEASRDCSNDYLQIDDLFEPTTPTATPSPTIQQPQPAGPQMSTAQKLKSFARNKALFNAAPTSKATPSTQLVLRARPAEPTTRRIGRWCGRVRPQGWFMSSSNKVRITFHSNERVEGKGFILEYSIIQPANAQNNATSDRQVPLQAW